MNYKFTSLKQVLDLFETGEVLSAGNVSEILGKSRVIAHKYLKALTQEGKIIKQGKAPHTTYKIAGGKHSIETVNIPILGYAHIDSISFLEHKLIDDIFFKFSPKGDILRGIEGMQKWCNERELMFEETLKQYIQIHEYIESRQDTCGMLHAEEAFGKHFKENFLTEVFYADQYIYAQFGRGKLAELAFYAKQSQSSKLIKETISEILPKLKCLIFSERFDAIAMTPWSIKRENQILNAVKKELGKLNIPFINVIKYSKSGIFIPQKSLKKSEDRIENAKNTIFVDDKDAKNYKKVLLIDDFVGSGATLNETAKKLKEEGVQEVHGFAFVGNTNLSYEVINEI
ncbi:hypothetical protein LR010_02970 [Candidatus Gracilibacteria bacterium]|nr:hypothetical protein [Candidatus Gracilibacteria bacterium]